MPKLSAISLVGAAAASAAPLLAAAMGDAPGGYDPEHPTEPFDDVAREITAYMQEDVNSDTHMLSKQEFLSGGGFCECLENGYIAGWYQYGSAMYLIDQCSPETGLVLRTGHLQDRHTEPLQGLMACDSLKLMSYCLKQHADYALPKWKGTCDNAHYTVPACDVDCNGSVRAGGAGGAFAAATASLIAAVAAMRR